MTTQYPLFESSVSLINFCIRRIDVFSLESLRSTPSSRSPNILRRGTQSAHEPEPLTYLTQSCPATSHDPNRTTTETYSTCSLISLPIRPACCASVLSVPAIESIVRSCCSISICCSTRDHSAWSSSGRGDAALLAFKLPAREWTREVDARGCGAVFDGREFGLGDRGCERINYMQFTR